MSDLKLKRIKIRNWMKISEAEIEFPEKGLVLVAGVNSASGGKLASVGSGKTAVGEAICRTLLGTRGRFTHAKSFSRDKNGDCYVCVEAEHAGQPLRVESGYRCAELSSSGEALRYRYGNKAEVERGKMDETRAEISSIIGVTPALADWTVFIDGRRIEFDRISQEESVNLVMAALMQPPWTQFFDRSKTVVSSFKQIAANDNNNHTNALHRLEQAKKDVEAAESSLAEEEQAFKTKRKLNDERITKLGQEKSNKIQASEEARTRQVSIRKRTEQIEAEKAKEQHALEIKRNEIDDQISAEQSKRDTAIDKRSAAHSAHVLASDKLAELKATPKDCPTCGKPWDTAHSAEEIEKQHANVATAKAVYDKKAAVVAKIDEKIAQLKSQRREIVSALSSLNVKNEMENLRDEYEQLEIDIRLNDKRIHSIELEIVNPQKDVSDSEVKAWKRTVSDRKTKVKDLEAEVKALAATLAENQETLKVATYWNKAFGPSGIPNMVLSEAIGPMNEVSRAISNRMTGGTIKVSYGTTRQLVSGGTRAQLVIKVDNEIGDSEIQGSSKGEGGLTNFIISETLSEVGNVSRRIGFRWYDEILTGMDATVRSSILAYLRETAKRLGILIFVVDHHQETEHYADYVLVVTKKKTGTDIEWAARGVSS